MRHLLEEVQGRLQADRAPQGCAPDVRLPADHHSSPCRGLRARFAVCRDPPRAAGWVPVLPSHHPPAYTPPSQYQGPHTTARPLNDDARVTGSMHI